MWNLQIEGAPLCGLPRERSVREVLTARPPVWLSSLSASSFSSLAAGQPACRSRQFVNAYLENLKIFSEHDARKFARRKLFAIKVLRPDCRSGSFKFNVTRFALWRSNFEVLHRRQNRSKICRRATRKRIRLIAFFVIERQRLATHRCSRHQPKKTAAIAVN